MTASDVRIEPRRGVGAAHGEPQRSFRSILDGDDPAAAVTDEPEFFSDLNLDQVVDGLVAGREEYNLRPLFHTPLRSVGQVRYRQQVLRGLEDERLAGCVRRFATGMREMRDRQRVAGEMRYPHQQARWMLDAVAAYCHTVRTFAAELADLQLRAPGWLGLRDYLAGYLQAVAFTGLAGDVRKLQQDLDRVTYCVRIHAGDVSVSPYEEQDDYSAEITAAFAKFRQGDIEPRRFRLKRYKDMNHVEAQILDFVAQLNPEVFGTLGEFPDRHRDFLDPTVAAFDREVQFYLAYLELIAPLRAAGLPFCPPEVAAEPGEVRIAETFDLALARKLVPEKTPVVCNDVALSGRERILVISGPNQGGKTTLARTIGQLHHLAALGLPVPGTSARLSLADRVFTQFERGENMADLQGKLADDLIRIRAVLQAATARSVVVINEIFTSTTVADAAVLGRKVLDAVIGTGCLAVYVTFVDELASMAPETVSMVSQVDPADPARRTHKVLRRPADGRAYADVLAAKYGLTSDRLTARITS